MLRHLGGLQPGNVFFFKHVKAPQVTKNISDFRINGIRKCDRNIKYSRGGLGFKFEIRVASDEPPRASSSSVPVRLTEIFVLDLHNNFSPAGPLVERQRQAVAFPPSPEDWLAPSAQRPASGASPEVTGGFE